MVGEEPLGQQPSAASGGGLATHGVPCVIHVCLCPLHVAIWRWHVCDVEQVADMGGGTSYYLRLMYICYNALLCMEETLMYQQEVSVQPQALLQLYS